MADGLESLFPGGLEGLDSLDFSSLLNPGPDPARLAARKDAEFLRALRGVEQTDQILKAFGEAPPPPTKPPLIFQALDTLTTPSQWLTGTLASLAGIEGYGDKGIVEAASKGAEEDITVSDILKETVLPGGGWQKPTRAVLGFVGDVALDPLTWLTGGTSGAVKGGGRALGTKALRTVTGELKTPQEILRGLEAAGELKAATRLKQAWPSIRESTGQADEILRVATEAGEKISPLRAIREAQAKRAAENPFVALGASLDRLNLYKATGAIENPEIASALSKSIQEAKSLAGIAQDVPLEDIFLPSAIRIQNPFTGNLSDIPFVTKASEKAYKTISDVITKGKILTTKSLDNVTKKLREGNALTRWWASGIDLARQFPNLISRRAQLGSEEAVNAFSEVELAKVAQVRKSAEHAEFVFRPVEELAQKYGLSSDAIFDELGTSLASRSDEAARLRLVASRIGAGAASDTDEGLNLFWREVNGIADKYSELHGPDLGQAIKNVAIQVRNDWERMADEALDSDILNNVIDNYFMQSYKWRPGIDPLLEAGKFSGKFAGGAAKFSLERTYNSLMEGVAAGHSANFNLKNVYVNRHFQQEAALAERAFMERLSLSALPEAEAIALQKAATGSDQKLAAAAIDFARQRGFGIGEKEAMQRVAEGIEKDLGTPAGVKFTRADGSTITPELYERMRQATEHTMAGRGLPGPFQDVALAEEAASLGLKFTPDEAQLVGKMSELYSRANLTNAVRGYSDLVESIGKSKVSEQFKGLVKASIKENPELANYVNGYLPNTVVKMLEESKYGANRLSKAAKEWESSGGLGRRFAGAIGPAAKMLGGLTSAIKWGHTQPFPGFHIRNMGSMAFMANQEVALLGEALNLHSLSELGKVIHKGADLRTASGKLIPNYVIQGLLTEGGGGLKPSMKNIIDIAEPAMDVLKEFGSTKNLNQVMRDVIGRKASDGALKIIGKLGKLSEAIEANGRGLMYLTLLRKGYGARTAADLTNKLFINYATGKTQFEKEVINNAILFYSFSRQQTVNSLMSLISKPGAITSQVHFRDAIANAIKDDEAPPLPPELQDIARNVKSKESVSKYVGRSKEGLPLLMSQVGVPIEDLARFTNPRAPREYTYQGLTEAAGLTIKDTMRMVSSQLHPVLKAPMEMMFGKSLFFDRPLTDKSLRKIRSVVPAVAQIGRFDPAGVPAEYIKKFEKGVLAPLSPRDNGDGTYSVDPYMLLMLSSFVPMFGRGISTINAMADETTDATTRLARLLTGVKITPTDLEQSAIFDRRAKQMEYLTYSGLPTGKRALLEQLMRERGEQGE